MLSLRRRLILLAVASFAPLLIFSLGRAYVQYLDANSTAGSRASAIAHSMALLVDQEMETRIAALEVLARSPALHADDLQVFRQYSERVVADQFPGSNIVLLREDGQQLMNTILPPDAPLPRRPNLETTHRVLVTGHPDVSPLYKGAVGDRLVFGIDVPVRGQDGSTDLVLSMVPKLDSVAEVIAAQHLPASWVVSIFDSRDVIVARVPNAAQFVGHEASPSLLPHLRTEREGITAATSLEGIPVITVFSHGDRFGWSVGIGVPRAELSAPAFRDATRTLAVGGVLILVSLGLALYLTRSIARPITSLLGLAGATDPSARLNPRATGLPETDEVAQALRAAEERRQQSEADERKARAALQQSEQKLAQAQKMEAIGQLTGGMAHDFNNLLGVVIGNLDLARAQLKGADGANELIAEALSAAVSGAELTRRLLAFARQQPLQPETIDVNKVIGGMVKLLHRMLGEQIEIVLDLDRSTWPVVADPAQLETSLVNLATNARDAMPNGGRLSISTGNLHLDAEYAATHSDVRPGDYARIEVSDDGSGIAPELLERVFEPFFTTKERGKGTGLGLSMVFGFMKQSGGHISVYSEKGKGTTFRLYLPRAAEYAQDSGREAAQAPTSGAGETILVVEDNAAMRRIALRQLQALGYRTLEAESAATALEILEREKVDLLFTDIVMPGGINGLELARAAMARTPALKIVLTSGFPEIKLNGATGVTGGMRLLSKPYRKEDLARMVREVLGG